MFTVEDWFQNLPAPPEHVVICAFEANLPFAEHQILDALHRGGAGHLTVLVGDTDYAESFADLAATRHAGVSYAFHRVRLAGRLAAFHPKLYLLAWRDHARLLVASANLTPSGFRSNLEIADELRLVPGEPSDVGAFLSYAELLRALPTVDPDLDERVAARLAAAASLISDLALRSEERSTPVRLVHNATQPLLEQLRAIVGPNAVQRLSIVSPFFDTRSAGVRALTRSLMAQRSEEQSIGTLRLFIDGASADELDGASLGRMAVKVRVDRVLGVVGEEEHRRRLHAKVLVLEGSTGAAGESDRAWVVAGSANATCAAWLRAAADGGNLEAITVRETSPASAEEFLASLLTEDVPTYADLRRAQRDEKDLSTCQSAITIASAVVSAEALEVRCNAGAWAAPGSSFRARLTSRDGSALLPLEISSTGGGRLSLRSVRSSDLLHSAHTVAVRIEGETADGCALASNSVWLDKPLYQELAPGLRAGIRALNQLGETTIVGSAAVLHDAAQFLASVTVRLASEIATNASRDPTGALTLSLATRGRPTSRIAEEGTEDSLDEADDVAWPSDSSDGGDAGSHDPGEDEFVPHLPGGATARRVDGGHLNAHLELTRRLFDGMIGAKLRELDENEARENARARREIARLGSTRTRPALDQSALENSDAAVRVALGVGGRRLLEQGLESLQRSLGRILQADWSADIAPQLALTVDALLTAMLRFAQHVTEWDHGNRTGGSRGTEHDSLYDLSDMCNRVLQESLARVWSTDGCLLGPSRGLYVRAAVNSSLSAALGNIYGDPARLARVAAVAAMATVARSVGAGKTVGPEADSGRVQAVPNGLVAGIRFVVHGMPLVSGPTAELLATYAAGFAASGGAPVETLLATLRIPPFSETSEGHVLHVWAPVIAIERERPNVDASAAIDRLPPEVPAKVISSYRQLIRRGKRLSSIVSCGGRLSCNACRTALPTSWAAEVRTAAFVRTCERCGSLLAPVAWEDPMVMATIDRLAAYRGSECSSLTPLPSSSDTALYAAAV